MKSPQAPTNSAAPDTPENTQIPADLEIDVTGEICPMTYVRTRLALDRLRIGQVLGVTLRGEEPARNVPHTARAQGQVVLDVSASAGGLVRVVIRKAK